MMHQKSILFLILLFYFGCNQSTESKDIYGCTISSACNFNADATIFDDSCINELDCWGECGIAIIDACGNCNGDCVEGSSSRITCGSSVNNTIIADYCGICDGGGAICG